MNNTLPTLSSQRILITGGSGFIGSHLVRLLISQGLTPHIIARSKRSLWRLTDVTNKFTYHTGDLLKPQQITAIVKKVKPTVVYHLASYGVVRGQTDPDTLKRVNLDATINLLQACADLPTMPHVVHTGSCFEYGSHTNRITERSVLLPETEYAASKAASTMYAIKFGRLNKLPITVVRPFTAYGPYEDKARLIPSLMLPAVHNTTPELSNPKPVRNFIYVEDVAKAYLAVTQHSAATIGEIYNICTNQEYSIGDIVSRIDAITGQSLKPRYNKALMRAYEPTSWLASYAKLNTATGWKPTTSITNGLRRTYHWFEENRSLYT